MRQPADTDAVPDRDAVGEPAGKPAEAPDRGGRGDRERPAGQIKPGDQGNRAEGGGRDARYEDDEPTQEPLSELYSDEHRRRTEVNRRRERRRAQSLLGDEAADVDVESYTNSGATAIGPHSTSVQVNLPTGERKVVDRARTVPLRTDVIQDLNSTYVQTASHSAIVQKLSTSRIVLLSGLPKTGRKWTARAALMEFCGKTNVADTHLPFAGELRTIDLDFSTGFGHVLELGPDRAAQLGSNLIAHIDQRLVADDARLVLIVDRGAVDFDGLDRQLVEHRPPVPARVVAANLRPRVDPERIEAVLGHGKFSTSLPTGSAPFEARRLAERIREHGTDDRSIDTVFERSRCGLRHRVRREFRRIDEPMSGFEGMAGILRRPAFMLACATLDRHLLASVLDAASTLIARLAGTQVPYIPSAREILEHRTEELLEAASATCEPTEKGPVVHLDPPEMAGAILEVAWREHPGLRDPFLAWLNTPGDNDRAEIRASVAQTVGSLAAHDFERVQTKLIDEWAGSTTRKQAMAAKAVGVLAEPRGRPESAQAAVRAWARGSVRRQYSAVLAYNTDIGRRFPAQALEDLSDLVPSRRHVLHHGLDFALEWVFRCHPLDEVVDLLADWAGSRENPPVQHAARLIVLLAKWEAAPDDVFWPPLLRLYETDLERRRVIERLLCTALRDRSMSHFAAKVLVGWTRDAHLDGAMEDVLHMLFAELARDDGLRRRLVFSARLRITGPPDPVLRRVVHLLEGGSGATGPRSI